MYLSAVVLIKISLFLFLATVLIKLFLFLYCRSIKSPSTQVLALDHRNDVVSNSFALVFGVIGKYMLLFL